MAEEFVFDDDSPYDVDLSEVLRRSMTSEDEDNAAVAEEFVFDDDSPFDVDLSDVLRRSMNSEDDDDDEVSSYRNTEEPPGWPEHVAPCHDPISRRWQHDIDDTDVTDMER